ncbi:MAG: PAS domain S-box protein [Dehalococcoidia bacterium]|nr:PAS domain S-box protein [Dehalococcoidia bacterium]
MLDVSDHRAPLDSSPLFELTQAVAAASDLDGIYLAALDCLESALGVRKASILLFDDEGVMRFRAWRNLSAEYRAAVDGHSPWKPGEKDPAPVLVPDVTADESLAGLRDVILGEGIHALAFVPLWIRGRLLGKFMLYWPTPHAFTEPELMLAQTVAANVAFGVDQQLAAVERDRAEQERRAHQDHLDAMFRASVAGIFEVGPDLRFRVVNDRFCALAGRTREELTGGLDCYDVTHPDDLPAAQDGTRALQDGAAHYTIDKRLLRPDGTVVWVASSISAIRDATGELAGAVGVLIDITGRKLAETALLESERRHRTLVEGMGIAAYTTDADGYITLYNDEAVRLWGREPEPGIDKWCGCAAVYDTSGERLPEEQWPILMAPREQRSVRGVEVILERQDGTRRHVIPHPTPLWTANGEIAGTVNVLVDITGLKKLESDLRTALQAKDDFLGLVSHELRTPLTAITGNSRSLLAHLLKLDEPSIRKALGDIVGEGDRLHRLVENMLVLSRVEGGADIDCEPMLLGRVLPRLLSQAERRCPDRLIRSDIPADLPAVHAEPSCVDHIVANLVSNAHKYSPRPEPIDVIVRAEDGHVRVLVLDRGPGVPPEDAANLFDPFFRGSRARDDAQGAGLGLAVCKRLAEAQGGSAWYLPRAGGGSEFGFSLAFTR